MFATFYLHDFVFKDFPSLPNLQYLHLYGNRFISPVTIANFMFEHAMHFVLNCIFLARTSVSSQTTFSMAQLWKTDDSSAAEYNTFTQFTVNISI